MSIIRKFLILPIFLSFINIALASDVSVWQGQYFTGTAFNVGTFAFNFTVYDAETSGNMCYSNATSLTTGNFGEWKTEQKGVGTGCNNASMDYFLEIIIDNATQSPRRRVRSFDFLRKDVPETVYHPITFTAPITGSALHIIAPVINNTVNQSGLVRNVIKNLDNGTNTTIISILENDQGYQFSMALASSGYNLTKQFEGENRSNIGVISLNAPNSMQFLLRYSHPFVWRIAENGTLAPQTEIMKLDPNGNLSVTGNITGDAGFFSYLGSLADRISKLWAVDIGASGNINASNYTLNGTTIDDWSDISASSLGADTVWNIIGSRYLYNNSGILDVNETKLNDTIDSKISGISSSSSGNGWVNDSTRTNTSLSVNVEGNITTSNYGFFGNIGSLTSRVTKLFVRDINVSGNLTGITKEAFFPIDSTDANLGDFRAKSVASGGIFRSNFQVPLDFSSLVSLEIVLVPAGTNAAAPVDLFSDYGAIGEAYNTHSESLSTTWNLGTANNLYAMDISGVFANLTAGDFCGIQVDEGAFGFPTDYLGIRLMYKT